jgi:hypothetical protein
MALPIAALRALVPALVLAVTSPAVPVFGEEHYFSEPDPPWIEGAPSEDLHRSKAGDAGAGAVLEEWLLHKTADGLHPDANEQTLIWLMNRARQDPTEEGLWLASSDDPEIATGRGAFNVDLDILEGEFASLAATPPAAFDRRLYEASKAHSLDLILRDKQDHNGQFDRIDVSGFVHSGGRASVFSFARSALQAHAAFNIDWGGNDGTGMQDGRGHRQAIMGDYTNVGIAIVAESNPSTNVGPLVTSAAYLYANTNAADHYNRFLVGTVWQDLDDDGMYDPGEGLGDVTVMASEGGFFAVTADSGGYAIPILSPGMYNVIFSGGDLGETHMRSVTVGTDSELLDLDPLAVPEPSATLLSATALLALGACARRSGGRHHQLARKTRRPPWHARRECSRDQIDTFGSPPTTASARMRHTRSRAIRWPHRKAESGYGGAD